MGDNLCKALYITNPPEAAVHSHGYVSGGPCGLDVHEVVLHLSVGPTLPSTISRLKTA